MKQNLINSLSLLVVAFVLVARGVLAEGGAAPVQTHSNSPFDTLGAAQTALEDGFCELAQKQAEAVLKDEALPPSLRGEATIVLARALYGQRRFKEMAAQIEAAGLTLPATQAGAMVYWHAVAQYESGNIRLALDELRNFEGRFPGSPLISRASRLEAWANLKEGRQAEALAVFERFDRQFGVTDEGSDNLLDWGQALLDSGNVTAARGILERLVTRQAELASVQDGKLLLAKALVVDGKWESAWNILTLMAGDPMVRLDRRALALLTISEVNAAQTNYAAAVTSASKAVDLAPTTGLKNRGRALWGKWLLRQKKIAEGAELLRPVIAQLTDDPVSGELQLELAAGYYDLKQFEKAAQEFQYYLETFKIPDGRLVAFKGRGLALWELQRYAEAATMFEKAAGLVTDPALCEPLLIKAADALFANAQYTLAEAAYENVLTRYPASALNPQVLYQLGECLARQLLRREAEGRFRELVRKMPSSPLAERALMRIAEMKEEQGPAFVREALAAYLEVMSVYPAGALFAEALHRHGLAAYQMGDIDVALSDFSRVVKEFPGSRVAPQAYFMRGWALYMRGQEEESLKVCKAFVERYPDSEWTPGVIFWIGEYAFNHGRYADAEARFIKLADKSPQDALADQSLIWAGRSAMMQKEYLRAVESLSRMTRTYPTSLHMAEARFLQADALSELGEFSRAILVFDELIEKFPNSPLVSAAWGRRGDCHFTLGATDPKRYAEAITSYRAVSRSPGTPFDLELQAEYKIGRCYDKMGKLSEAFEQYYTRVVCRYLADKQKDSAAAVWFTKAAFSAADILELEKNWKRAMKVLERVEGAQIPASADARKRIEQIRSEHWVW
ncbi:MAG: tetratricopeptide repeat protein [bacterium]